MVSSVKISASTYALIDSEVAIVVAEAVAKESSSRTAAPETAEVTYRVETFATVIFASGVVTSVEVKTVPSKVNPEESSISPLVPAKTTLPSVKSKTFAH